MAGANMDICFNSEQYKRKQLDKVPFVKNLFQKCPNLRALSLGKVKKAGRDISLGALELFNTILEEGGKSNLEILDLSGNNLNKDLAKCLGSFIEKLPELKTLNLSGCKLGVAGGHLLKTP